MTQRNVPGQRARPHGVSSEGVRETRSLKRRNPGRKLLLLCKPYSGASDTRRGDISSRGRIPTDRRRRNGESRTPRCSLWSVNGPRRRAPTAANPRKGDAAGERLRWKRQRGTENSSNETQEKRQVHRAASRVAPPWLPVQISGPINRGGADADRDLTTRRSRYFYASGVNSVGIDSSISETRTCDI